MENKQTKIKICGLQDANSTIVAADAGADFLGFNFVLNSKRRVNPEQCIGIIDEYREKKNPDRNPYVVGLFRNQAVGFVNDISQSIGLDYIQLCGNEDQEYLSKIKLPIFKQVWVKPNMSTTDVDLLVSPFLDNGYGIVLDSYSKGSLGGSGKTFDWNSAVGIANRKNILLAGGLKPENVQSAIDKLAPWGVDVASGVETDGMKDPKRIRAFVKAVNNA
ncbi:MAG: phosphoribosylanthranilate isomerase [SAR202 cluster bacterium]|nr:phosphoribosylanthranilate isomerase [SAR202 cluster bacterium]